MDKKDWLREEIVRLEGMKKRTELDKSSLAIGMQEYWHNQALQTIIDRYHSELDQNGDNYLQIS